jgi:hypothetical protein
MPRDQALPVPFDLLGALAHTIRNIQQKEHPGRIWSGSQSIDRGESVVPQTVSPILDLGEMAAFPASVMVVDD